MSTVTAPSPLSGTRERATAGIARSRYTWDADSTDADLFRALAGADFAERDHIQDLLVRRYAGLVGWLASRYANRAVETAELRQVGFVGLVLAINRFDPDRGSDFNSFARPTVQGEIRRYFRDKRRWIRVPRRLQEARALLREATETLTQRFGRAPTVFELAGHLSLDVEFVLEAMTADDTFAPASLDATIGADADGSYTVADMHGAVEARYELFEDCLSLGPMLAALPKRERRILEMRFVEDATQAQIGLEVGLSQMHISRLLAQTLADLRTQLEAD